MHTETMHAQRSVHSKKEKHGKIFSGTNDDSRKSKHSDSKSEVINESESSIVSERQVDIMTRGESGKNDDSHTHINETKGTSASARKSGSSSSSESSFDDYFGMNELKFATSGSSTSKSGKDYVSSSESSSKSEVDNSLRVNTSSTFKVYNVAKPQKGTSPISSPPVQVMERTGVYDPARIPSSVFERNPNQLDWSEASNESLFSLHVGNNSFSRERMLGEAKSGELNFVSGEFTKSGELNLFSRTPSILIEEIDTTRKSVEVENPQTTETSDEAFKSEERLSEDQDEIKSTDHPASSKSSKANVSSLSHDSENSTRSFAFPISVHGHFATVLIVAGRSAINGQPAAIRGQAVSVQIVAGRSATVGTIAIQKALIMPPLYWRKRKKIMLRRKMFLDSGHLINKNHTLQATLFTVAAVVSDVNKHTHVPVVAVVAVGSNAFLVLLFHAIASLLAHYANAALNANVAVEAVKDNQKVKSEKEKKETKRKRVKMSSCKGKSSWEELVGTNGDAATQIIMRENPRVKARTVPKDSVVTTDFRCDRVRVFVDNQNIVARVPIIG
ncbi:hypothetical protein RIF29_16063 [Crotalaria pallida]|uniref:Uncharacterized protein n=1 Tax=Crotalaria pallida TaxID=3830 RepID=A0AAN9IF82_CROPI